MRRTRSCRALLVAAFTALSCVSAVHAQDVPAPQDLQVKPDAKAKADDKKAADETTLASEPTPAADEQQGAPPAWPPQYQTRFFDENWAPANWQHPHQGARDIFDKLKAIPLEKNGWAYLNVGGQARGRYARQSTVTFGGPYEFQPVMWTYMFQAYADLHIGPHIRAYGELIYSHSSINGNRLGSNTDFSHKNGDFVNAFGEGQATIEKWDTHYWAGRRELLMGHERILSPGNWLLNRHTYDGAGGWLQTPKGKRFEGFLVRPRIPVPDAWSTKDDHTTFWGFFYTDDIVHQTKDQSGKVTGQHHVFFQPYLLRIKREGVTFVQGTADEERYTFGSLIYGDIGSTGMDFEVEEAYQYGNYKNTISGETGHIHAAMATVESGYRFKSVKLQPRPYFSFDYASGDRDQSDKELNTFDPLYPLAWSFFGFHAAFERKNIMIAGAHLEMTLRKNLYFKTAYWPGMWRASLDDGLYDSFGNIIRRPEPQSRGGNSPDLTVAARSFGQQADVGVAYIPTHHLLFYATYLYFMPGDFVKETQTAPAHPMNGVMALAQFRF
jgi:Alginate export